MNTRGLEKDPSIVKVLEELSRAFPDQLEIEDHWDADLCAVGVVSVRGGTARLVYISTWQRPRGEYWVELEEQLPAGDQAESRTLQRFESIDFRRLVEIVRDHLQLATE